MSELLFSFYQKLMMLLIFKTPEWLCDEESFDLIWEKVGPMQEKFGVSVPTLPKENEY
jgi:hypothetical protein